MTTSSSSLRTCGYNLRTEEPFCGKANVLALVERRMEGTAHPRTIQRVCS